MVSAQREVLLCYTYRTYLPYSKANMTSSSRGCSRTAQRLLCMYLLSFGVLQLEWGVRSMMCISCACLGEECELAGCVPTRWKEVFTAQWLDDWCMSVDAWKENCRIPRHVYSHRYSHPRLTSLRHRFLKTNHCSPNASPYPYTMYTNSPFASLCRRCINL